MKRCKDCHEEKPLADFGKKSACCKPCAVLRTTAWAKANPERVLENARRTRDRNRARRREINLRSYHKRMAENPEQIRRNRREWAKTPKGVVANRAARHARRGAPLSPEAKAWWLSLVDPVCHYCPAPAVEIDHVIPITKGGTGDVTNLVPACRSCNASKNDRLISA